MINDDENVALCALNKIFGYHPRLALSLMEAAGSAAAVFSGEKPCLPGYPELAAQLNASTLDWAAAEIKSVTEKGFRFLGLSDPEYPDALREISAARKEVPGRGLTEPFPHQQGRPDR